MRENPKMALTIRELVLVSYTVVTMSDQVTCNHSLTELHTLAEYKHSSSFNNMALGEGCRNPEMLQ